MNNVNASWKRMREKRTCPPLDVLESGGEAVEQHLLGCEHCREVLENAEGLKALARALPKGQKTMPAHLKTGDICQLLQSASPNGIYNDHGWHNPPMVIVIEVHENFVRVAQLHDAPALAGEGDFPLTGMYSDHFAESWNTWPAMIKDLRWLGEVQPEIATAITEAANRSHPVPPQGSVAFSFRQQELNIGGFFGRRAAAQLA